MRNPYRQLEVRLGYRFRRKHLLETALTHPSYRHEVPGIREDNQRLEYLGDAVLGLLAADRLYRLHEDLREGDLTKLRSHVASRPMLARIAERLDLGQHLRLGRGEKLSGGARRPSILADALEAVVGAAFVDGGLKAGARIFNKLFAEELRRAREEYRTANPKGSLQEYAQHRWKTSPIYRLLSQEGPPHRRRFTVEVLVHGRPLGVGQGASKREAETDAARHALHALELEG